MPDDAADQGNQNRHAGGCRNEVLNGQAQHLGQVAHRGLAAIALPVGIGDEAGGSVECQIRGNRADFLWVQREPSLQALEHDHHEHASETEKQYGCCVGLPIHLIVGVDTCQSIDEVFNRAQESG